MSLSIKSSSSNGGALVSFAANPKDVFVTYPSEKSVYEDASNVVNATLFGAITATSAALTTGTITTAPVNNTDIVNKEYADAIASGIHFHEAVALATTAALPANTYNNGTSGVGATLTGNANGALSIDSTLTIVTERVLIKNEANGSRNGVYTVTQVGSAGTPYILTRATDFDAVGTGVDQIDEGDFFLVTSGVANLNTAWVQQTAPPITIGTTAIVFQQFAAPITYTAGTGLSESPTYTFNIANIGTAGTYGSGSNVPVFTTNAQGQVTSVTNTAIAIASGAVSGLAASATTDTTNAANITSGTLPTARLSGSYTGITGVGTLTAGTWNATTIAAVYGGTGLTSYAIGDLVYADTTTTLAKLPDVATGNALISGGVGAAPSYGKIGLATHVSGTLPIANGGTNSTATPTNGGVAYGTGTAFAFNSAGTSGQVLTSAGAAAPTWTSQSSISVGTATNIAGGAANQVVYQSGSGATAFATAPTVAGTSLTWNGSAFVWQTAGGATIQNDTSTNSTFYPTFATATSGAFTDARVSSTKLTFNPNTGLLSVSALASAGTVSGTSALFSNQGRFSGWYTSGTGLAAEIGISSGDAFILSYNRTTSAYGSLEINALNIRLVPQGGTLTGPGGNVILHAGNYNSYAPTLTGTGASGTWGINVTGNAATATTLQTARTINLTSFNGSNSYTLRTSGYSSVFATYPSLGAFELRGNISLSNLPALKFPTGAPFFAASFFPPIFLIKYLNLLF